MRYWLNSFVHLLFPHCCIICNAPLYSYHERICIKCNINLPRTNYHLTEDNPVEKLLWGKINIEKATSFCFYKRGSDFKQILYQLKYKGDYELGINLGKQIANELSQSDFFNGIDFLIPVPLHKKKHKKRGYNQSEQLATGIFHIINIPLDNTSVIRTKDTDTQTHKSALERWENVENIFAVKNPNPLHHKHILLIDDVITTGSTLVECACELQKIPGIKISILTLALAHQ